MTITGSTTATNEITTGGGADTVTGGNVADIISSGAGADILDGGTGNDVITGGTGADTIDVGTGVDTVVYTSITDGLSAVVTITSTAATAAGVAGDKLEISLTLAAGGVTFTETDRGDVASTAEAPGNLAGVAGDFVFNDGTSEFMLDVNGDGNINVNDLVIGLTDETAFAASDVVFNITGGSGADIITLGGNDNTVAGAAGVDTITTGAGADSISAGAGDDVIVAGAGNDTIADSADNDTMTGGAGADILTVTTGTNIMK
jgi:serralysin